MDLAALSTPNLDSFELALRQLSWGWLNLRSLLYLYVTPIFKHHQAKPFKIYFELVWEYLNKAILLQSEDTTPNCRVSFYPGRD